MFQALAGRADARGAGALIAEQEFRAVPAAVLLADQLIDRNLDVLEEAFVDLGAALHGVDRPYGHAGGLHVHQQEGDAFLFLCLGVGADQKEHPVRVLCVCGPHLGTVDDVMVAFARGAGAQRGEVGAGAGLGKALAPPVVQIGHPRQEALLLFLRSKMRNDRAAQVGVHAVRQRGRRGFELLAQDETLDGRPVLATPFDRPVRHRPAFGVELAMPVDDVLLVGDLAVDQLLLQLGRQVRPDPGPNLVAERQILFGEAHLHVLISLSLGCTVLLLVRQPARILCGTIACDFRHGQCTEPFRFCTRLTQISVSPDGRAA